MTGRRVLVCGGRDYNNFPHLYDVLDSYSIDELCHGAAPGADFYAGAYAQERFIPCVAFPADWKRDGKAAGPIRNQRMLSEFKPDLVIAFPGGRGTAHMVAIARRAGVEVVAVDAVSRGGAA
jgi:hypothetical protein